MCTTMNDTVDQSSLLQAPRAVFSHKSSARQLSQPAIVKSVCGQWPGCPVFASLACDTECTRPPLSCCKPYLMPALHPACLSPLHVYLRILAHKLRLSVLLVSLLTSSPPAAGPRVGLPTV
jgi:hypothetical protein